MIDFDTTIAWIHGDNLSPVQPALTGAYAGVPAIWVWDEALLAQWQISTKRLVFIYECLLELPVTIRRGDVATEVVAFAHEHNAGHIVTSDSPGPRFRQACRAISHGMPGGSRLEVLKPQPFVDLGNDALDLKRFSRYWRTVKDLVLR